MSTISVIASGIVYSMPRVHDARQDLLGPCRIPYYVPSRGRWSWTGTNTIGGGKVP